MSGIPTRESSSNFPPSPRRVGKRGSSKTDLPTVRAGTAPAASEMLRLGPHEANLTTRQWQGGSTTSLIQGRWPPSSTLPKNRPRIAYLLGAGHLPNPRRTPRLWSGSHSPPGPDPDRPKSAPLAARSDLALRCIASTATAGDMTPTHQKNRRANAVIRNSITTLIAIRRTANPTRDPTNPSTSDASQGIRKATKRPD